MSIRSGCGGSLRAFVGLSDAFSMARKDDLVLWSLWAQLGRRQIAQPHQVVGGQGEGKHPTHSADSAMASLAQAGDGLEPAKDFFHAFALLLADQIARMTGGAVIDDAGLLARYMGSYQVVAQLLYKLLGIVPFVGAQGNAPPARDLLHHRHRRLRFSAPGGLSYTAVERQAVTVFHQHVSGVTELGLLALTLAGQQRFGVGGGLVGVVA